MLYYPLSAFKASLNVIVQQIEYSFSTAIDYNEVYPFGSDLNHIDYNKLFHWSSENIFDYGYYNPNKFISVIDKSNGGINIIYKYILNSLFYN